MCGNFCIAMMTTLAPFDIADAAGCRPSGIAAVPDCAMHLRPLAGPTVNPGDDEDDEDDDRGNIDPEEDEGIGDDDEEDEEDDPLWARPRRRGLLRCTNPGIRFPSRRRHTAPPVS